MKVKFGTDGWRGVIADDFTFDNVRACAQATARYLEETGVAGRGVVIGYDTRFASEDFAQASAEVLAGCGVKAFLFPRPTPTPVTVFGLLEKKAGAGIIITASHNPPRWNGFKLRDQQGIAISPETASHLERLVVQALSHPTAPITLEEARSRGLVEGYDPRPAYLRHLGRLVDLEMLRRSQLRVVVDPMFGAGMGYLRELLADGGIDLQEIHGDRNPLFPGLVPEPIPANLAPLAEAVKAQGASLGLATDGDADRVGVVDERGNPLSAPEAFSLLALYLLEVKGERGAIVKSLPSTAMLDRLAASYGVPLHRTPVGFKHIAPLMLSGEALLGGEESGGYAFRGSVPERDGIMASLCFLDLLLRTGKPLSELVKYLYQKVGYHHYQRWDSHFPASQREGTKARLEAAHPTSLDGVAVARRETMDGYYFLLQDGSWLLLRFSGTEPLIRIYAESTDPRRVERLLQAGRKLAGV